MPDSAPGYRERLYPSLLSYLAWSLVFPSVWLVVSAVFAPGALMLGLLSLAVVWLLLTFSAPMIHMDETNLSVAGAKIPLALLGTVKIIGKAEAFDERGPRLDARAFRVFAPGIRTLVRVEIVDPADPTPYWLFATRNPERVTELLTERAGRKAS